MQQQAANRAPPGASTVTPSAERAMIFGPVHFIGQNQ